MTQRLVSDGQPATTTLDHLVERFDVFFVDQFGVLHDGKTPYPGAIDALSALRRAGKRIVLVSNSGKRARVNEARLTTIGFARENYDVFLTSGEVAWQQLDKQLIGQSIRAGGRCLFVSRDDDRSAVDGLDLVLTSSVDDADVIIVSGCRDDLTLSDYDDMLLAGISRDVPVLCTNPDKQMIVESGLKFGAGEIAQRYAERGGQVTWIGKPYPAIYTAAIEAMGNPLFSRIVCLGDSVEHDIAGGRAAGCSTALVQTGIAQGLDEAALQARYAEYGVVPDFLLPTFSALY